jgi:pilus assembly protein CpaE
MTILLIIDDEITYLKLISHAVEPMNWQIQTAENGRQGLEMARSLKPDLIITDVVMPDISGYEVTRQLRRDPDFSHTPIVVLTAQSGLQDKLQSFEAGADDHLTKPFEPAELIARLNVLLRRAEGAGSVKSLPAGKKAFSIGVHSLRGGTGSSSLAVNFAVGFASLWKTPTLLLDLNMVAGQVALMLNASLKRTWADLARVQPEELDTEILDSISFKHESGLTFIAAPTFPSESEMISGETLSAAIKILWRNYDYIVADLAHDFNALTIQVLDAVDMILLIATPDMASVRAAAAALDTYGKFDYPAQKIKLILNATFPRSGLTAENIEAALKIPIAATIPYTQDLFVKALNLGQPLIYSRPEEHIASLLEDLVFLMSRDSDKRMKPANPSEVWSRIYQRYFKKKKKEF